MLVDHLPLYGLRVRTPDLELRLPDLPELARLGDVAGEGVHDPGVMPFMHPWTQQSDVGRHVILSALAELGQWRPGDWSLGLVAFRDGEPVGRQILSAREFAVTREVRSWSWLGRRFHGQGLGTQMRTAVLALAFDGLDALSACSAAFLDNHSSLRVSEKLGYQPDGIQVDAVRGAPTISRRLRLTRERWSQHSRVPVEIEGLDPCREMFGA
ncbi:MAG: GNAT family N-acetyltransferase [Hamadaea sp.]|uniref:GNAT family N-acetyltransferase n=1 Tax=Hamadaea sp. TaxID=2024425 RepID=UPI001802F9EF|nr:GNAT family N-acetyltransferase [Hamadaea sp.]NUR74649.1 GNAT family N-acetyltransferase [Hamadaea sp.]NUT21141.1 GNAT family N-acetyltransferase [Hamadaea sp.]